MGGPVVAGELRAALVDAEGQPTTAAALWTALRSEAPAGVSHAVLRAFEAALRAASDAAERDDLDGVLALEPAFATLARAVEGSAKP